MAANSHTTILTTGGSGLVSLHCIAQALSAGYRVRTTIRRASRKADVIKGLHHASPPIDSSLVEFVIADLLADAGWADAVKDVSLVLHVASPFPGVQPKDENDLLRPAVEVEGTLRVLNAAKAAGTVRRVVLTSSQAAISYGADFAAGKVFTEADWSDPNGKYITPYAKSKTRAEKAAWKFMEREGRDMELTVINPVAIFGPPLLLPCESTSVGIIAQMLDGKLPAVPDVSFSVVDVRDVASLHLLAAVEPEAAGQWYQCCGESGPPVSLAEVGGMLKKGLGEKARRAPTGTMLSFLVKLVSYVMPQLKTITHELRKRKNQSNEKARRLGWSPRGNVEAIVSCGQALIDAGAFK